MTARASAFLIAAVAVAAAVGLGAHDWLEPATGHYTRLVSWVIQAGVIGLVLRDVARPKGLRLTLDPSGKPSLPRWLTLAWFVLVMSAFLACSLWNVVVWTPAPGGTVPIFVNVPGSIWMLAGITVTTVVAAEYVTELKVDLKLVSRRSPPATTDIRAAFTYEQAAMADAIDIGAVQVFLVQIATFVAYAAALGRLMVATSGTAAIGEFPSLPDGIIALLGLSAGGFLAIRAWPLLSMARDPL